MRCSTLDAALTAALCRWRAAPASGGGAAQGRHEHDRPVRHRESSGRQPRSRPRTSAKGIRIRTSSRRSRASCCSCATPTSGRSSASISRSAGCRCCSTARATRRSRPGGPAIVDVSTRDSRARRRTRQRRPQPGRRAPARQSALLARSRERPADRAAVPRQVQRARSRRTRRPTRPTSRRSRQRLDAAEQDVAAAPREHQGQAGRRLAHELALFRRVHGHEHRRVHGAEARRSAVAVTPAPA